MAVNLTYCRAVSHDRAYFLDPIKMLGGRVEPPSFNLSNGLMVAKHVHATVLTVLYQLARPASGLPEAQREEISEVLRQVFPTFVRGYLFEGNGDVRQPNPMSVESLGGVVSRHEGAILKAVRAAFGDGWPTEDLAVVTDERLLAHVRDMAGELGQTVSRLYRRLRWALSQMAQLDVLRSRTGTLDEERKSFYERCDRFVKRMKGQNARHARREAEGVDDTLTISVLAAEGFLPGYGLEVGAVVGFAEVPKWVRGLRDFSLPRPPSVAVREYVPGNLIYANGQRFVPRRFMWDADENRTELLRLAVNMGRQSVVEYSGAGGDSEAGILTVLPISDVTLVHQSRISDEEENRFQMGVNLFGREVGQHRGGIAYQWGDRSLLLRKGVRLQLVNVGTPFIFNSRQELGYPVCRACGQSVSPFSSERQREEFTKNHAEWCGVAPGNLGFYADLTADVLTLPECKDRTEAYSIMEGLRFAATEVLNMDVEDLQVMVIGHPDRDECDALLYDPMPGGSGLIEQLCERFADVVAKAQQLATDCPGRCVASCIDCFRTYRNAGYHKYLDRTVLIERVTSWGPGLNKQHDIPPRQPSATPPTGQNPIGVTERRLRDMLKAASFADGRWQESLQLPHPLGSTTPDVTFDDPHEPERRIFIYLDGLSEHIHGNATTRQRDLQIRNELRAEGHEVVEIPASHLDDRNAMSRHFRRLARFLMGPDAMEKVTAMAETWFPSTEQTREPTPVLRVVDGGLATAWKDCVPRTELKVAAGQFSPEQGALDEQGEWIADWVTWDSHPSFERGMFVAQVVGKSMEPMIPDGAYCLFRSPRGGSREGRIVLVWHGGVSDPHTGGQYTVKVYSSDKLTKTDVEWEHTRITLKPLNSAFEPITLEPKSEGDVRILAEFVGVVGN
jgi:SOS-response transcriptional repressor LexA